MQLIFVDTETGGLDPTADALLSVGLVDWRDGNVVDTCEILVDAEGLRCTDAAMAVNKIDLDYHHGLSVPRSEAGRLIRDWCKPRGRVWLAGHNVTFDVGFLRRLFEPGSWGASFSHRTLDTMNVLAFLGHAGLIPDGIGKLDKAITHFGIPIDPDRRHTALADAVATAHLYTAMLDLARRRIA